MFLYFSWRAHSLPTAKPQLIGMSSDRCVGQSENRLLNFNILLESRSERTLRESGKPRQSDREASSPLGHLCAWRSLPEVKPHEDGVPRIPAAYGSEPWANPDSRMTIYCVRSPGVTQWLVWPGVQRWRRSMRVWLAGSFHCLIKDDVSLKHWDSSLPGNRISIYIVKHLIYDQWKRMFVRLT